MANSSIIGDVKIKIAKDFIKDKEIVLAIDSKIINKPEKLIDTHIFTYNQNPFTLQDVQTFITIQIHIPESFLNSSRSSENRLFVKPIIEIWITSHEQHMKVDNVPKISQNRNDYLSQLIDEKLNGRTDFGIGKLRLVSNVESAYEKDYLMRKMIFETKDLNDSLCDIDE